MTVLERGPAGVGPPGSFRAQSTGGAAADSAERDAQTRERRDERRTVTVAFAAALAAFAPTAAGATVVAGGPGLLGALVGTLLVLVLFGAGAALMLWAGRRGPSAMTSAAAGGVGVRLMIYAAVLTALDGTDLVHRPSLAVATVVTLIITLAGEFAVLSRTPSLFRLQVPPTAPTARPPAPDGDLGRSVAPVRPAAPDGAQPTTGGGSTDVSNDRSTTS